MDFASSSPSQSSSRDFNEQHGTQMRTPRHSDNDITNSPSGDTNSNQTQPQNTQTNIANPLNINKNMQNDKTDEMNTTSKASVKSTDDFDVNEYFARLQGTRYVSAPLNSNVPDQNANLQAEENLEEINLNDSIEPDKGSENIQNSLTADIAQNFSQLPNVLPHVANAVFNSFSNMLSLRSREVTPDEAKPHEVQYRAETVNVPLPVPQAVVSSAPPPLKEPPMSGTTSNYRITTKKKVYAQVPGLSSGDHQHTQTFNPGPISQSTPTYFIPDTNVSNVPSDHSKIANVGRGFDVNPTTKDQAGLVYGYNSSLVPDNTRNVNEPAEKNAHESITEKISICDPTTFVPTTIDQTGYDDITDQVKMGPGYVPTLITSQENKEKLNVFDSSASLPRSTCQTRFDAKITDQTNTENFHGFTQITADETKERFNLLNQTASVNEPIKIQTVESYSSLQTQNIPHFGTSVSMPTEGHPGLFSQSKPNTVDISEDISSQTSIHNFATEFMPLAPQGSTTVIPPPPMFSNIPRREGQATVEKSVLPPSVARRISANQPIIKPRAMPTMIPQDNIFIPTIPFESENHLQQTFALSENTFNSSNNKDTDKNLNTEKTDNNTHSQIKGGQTFPANNQQSSFQMHAIASSKPINLFNTSVPVASSSNTILPVLPTSASLISEGSLSLPLSAAVPLISKDASSTDVFISSQPPKTNQPTKPPSFASDTIMKLEDVATASSSFKNCKNQTSDITQPLTTAEENIAPPIFFNPDTLNQTSIPSKDIQKNQDTANKEFAKFMANPAPEPLNEIPQPPKIRGHLNYRLTKKKPQYYSGPIEGVGNISNNVKPVISPIGPSSFHGAVLTPEQNVQSSIEKSATDFSLRTGHDVTRQIDLPKPPTGPSLFQGAIFTPDQNVQPVTQKFVTGYSSHSASEIAPPFDLNKPAVPSCPTFDVNEPQERKPQVYNDFNTAFDMSRPTTEKYEDTRQETKGFGIIGSLKSKLSSIDINKIQNTVTTFFDPAYNETKVEEKKHDNNWSVGNYQNFPQTESVNLEVFIPSVQEQINPNPYNYYQTEHAQAAIQPQYHHTQEYFNQAQNYPNPGWGNLYHQQPIVQKSFVASSFFPNPKQGNHKNETKPSIEAEKLYTDTAILTQDHISETASEKNLKENESDKVARISKLADTLTPNSVVHQEQTKNKEVTLSDTRMEGSTEKIGVLSFNEKKSIMSQSACDSSLKSFFDYTDQEQQSLFDNIVSKENDFKNANIVYGHSTVADSFTTAFDLQEPLNRPALHSKMNEHNFQLKTIDSLIEDMPRETSRVFSNISAKDFFDKQLSQENLITSLPEKTDIGIELLQKTSDTPSKSYFDYGCTKTALNVSDSNDLMSNKVLYNIFDKQSTADVDTSKELLTTVILPVLKDLSDDLVPPQYLDDSVNDKKATSSSFEKQINTDGEEMVELCQSTYKLFDFGQSDKISTIADSGSYKDIKDIEEKIENVSLTENSEFLLKHKSSLSDIFEKSDTIDLKEDLLDHQVSELNICETCREVKKPEEKDVDDLTTQLIENITAPIQLANPVEYPFVERSLVTDKSEISHITEDILETMKLPPPVELIDDISVSTNINYGWSTNEVHSSNVLQGQDYGFQIDPLSLGFCEDKTLIFENIPTNASDEIKAEYRFSQEDTILPPPINVPTAPPEEDTKSDESGLDVHSIEQDAKKDFPIYEEFVIEPSETDDDKIEYKERERSSDDPIPDADTFTNRVERYKKMETNPDPTESMLELRKDSLPFELPTSASPALTIASYFDTGNYAVENHYKNSLTFPSTLSSFAVNSPSMCIPPGFEDEYKRKLTDIAASRIVPGLDQNITFIPDTSTQTSATATLTANNSNIIFIPDTSTQTRSLATLTYSESPVEILNISDVEVKTMIEKIVEDSSSPTLAEGLSSVVDSKKETREETVDTEKEPRKIEEPKLESLPDPINFFSSNAESTNDADVYSNFSRLSSYFTSPPKPDHTKSFFELSQSQDHYRHKPKNDTFDSIQNNVKSFFETTSLNNQTKSIADSNSKTTNIPQINVANMNLVRDLTSYKNFNPNENVVRTVNYFSVEIDAENAKEINIGEPKVSTHLVEKEYIQNTDKKYDKQSKNNQLGDENNLNFENIIKHCKYCCDPTKNFAVANGVDFVNLKVRKAMDVNTDAKKEGDRNMALENDTKKPMSVNFLDQTFQDDNSDRIVTLTEHRMASDYAPVKYHWFYRIDLEEKSIWRGFSAGDSKALEEAYNSPELNEATLVATDGGRYDVNVMARTRTAVYWTEKPTNVMRCSWFYKSTALPRYVPYTESIAEKLEELYHHSVTSGEWHRRLMLPNDEMVVMHGPAVMVHFLQASSDALTATPLFVFGKSVYRNPPKINVSDDQPQHIDHLVFMVHGAGEWRNQKQKIQSMRQRVVRGCVESEIEDTEPSSIDHLLLMCHGVGSACDMRFRSVEEVVDDFRSTSLQLVQSHYKNSYDSGLVGRVEVLPISWHSSLHSGETGVDTRLAAVTLDSIPRLRNFTNDTLLDVLFYTSPVFCQTIIDTVCSELNRIYSLFKKRNPDYEGGVSLGGHSLGSVILYDLLCHQMPKKAEGPVSTDKQYVTGTAGTGQPSVKYPRLNFNPDALYALGSPIAIFECIRGVQTLGRNFCLPTCKNFFNIFHPYDPIAYRIEPMVNPLLRDVKPYLIPHHKGRKRMHLELKDTMARVGADIKQKLIESIKSTWSSMWKTQPPPDRQLEKVVEEEIEKEALNSETKEDQLQEHEVTAEMLGALNDGRRIDHVLQEAPFEMINEYLFAMSSHVCYWESEDTMLVMLREIYNALGVTPDCSVPQQSMTVQRSRQDDSISLSSQDSPSTSRGGS